MKHKVALILTYFGKLPGYFPFWLKSAGANSDFTFMIFSDADFSGYKIPGNVKVIPMTLEGVRKLAAPHFDFECSLKMFYKVCDYKTLNGLIFQDWLKGYDFWGHVDPDVIWGKLDDFITDDLLDKYGRLYRRGHLTLYRNTPEVNSFALHELPYYNVSYKDIFRMDKNQGFCEGRLVEHLFSHFVTEGGGQYDNPDFADVDLMSSQFVCIKYTNYYETVPAFRWKNGKLYGLSIDGEKGNDREYLYLHLQKRIMKFTPDLLDADSFMIIPDEFVKDHELTDEETVSLMLPNFEHLRMMAKKYDGYAHMVGEKYVEYLHKFAAKYPEYADRIIIEYDDFVPPVHKKTIFERIINFIFRKSIHEKILTVKNRINKIRKRKLSSMWKSRGVADTYGIWE